MTTRTRTEDTTTDEELAQLWSSYKDKGTTRREAHRALLAAGQVRPAAWRWVCPRTSSSPTWSATACSA